MRPSHTEEKGSKEVDFNNCQIKHILNSNYSCFILNKKEKDCLHCLIVRKQLLACNIFIEDKFIEYLHSYTDLFFDK